MRDRQPAATPSMLDRRALCTAALVLPALTVAPARATSAGNVIGAELSALIAANRAAEHAFRRHEATVYEPALASAVKRAEGASSHDDDDQRHRTKHSRYRSRENSPGNRSGRQSAG